MNTFLIIIAYGELLIWIAAFLLFYFYRENTFAESFAYAIISTLMTFSFVFQVNFILGIPAVSFFLEAILTIGAMAVIVKLRSQLWRIWEILKFVTIQQTLVIIPLFAVFFYLAYLANVFVSETAFQDMFSKIRLYEQYETFFLPDDLETNVALFPVNIVVLSHLFLRAGSQVGTGLFGFLAYLSIGFSTYALSRRYAWPATAFTVTFITLSLPRLVFLSTTPGEEIIPAAVSLFCILAIYRAQEHPDIQDLILLISGILFSISGKFLCIAFPVILIILSSVLFIRRHGTVTWTSLVIGHWKIALAAAIPIFIFSQSWLFAYNIFNHGGWLGNPGLSASMPLKDNVLLGALANVGRYFFELIQLTKPVEMIFKWAVGFILSWMPNGQLSWFGPFGVVFVMPSIIMAIFRGHRRLKAIGVALAGYVYIVALVIAWRPGNAQFFTIVFTCGGFCVSFLLPPWRFTTAGKKCLQVISILLLIYVCLFNVDKPILKLPELSENISWQHVQAQNRLQGLFRLPPIVSESRQEDSYRFLSS